MKTQPKTYIMKVQRYEKAQCQNLCISVCSCANMSFFLCLNKNKRAYSRLLKQRKFKIENLENEYKLPLI